MISQVTGLLKKSLYTSHKLCKLAPATASTAAATSVDEQPQIHNTFGYSFELTTSQRHLYETARQFVKEQITSQASHYDETGEFPWPIIKQMHQQSFMNTNIPSKYGGIGLDAIARSLLFECFGYGCTRIASAMLANELTSTALIISGNEQLKKKYLERIVNEPVVTSYAVIEPEGGLDAANIKTKCSKKGDKWIINGSKLWMTNCDHVNFFLVLAQNDLESVRPSARRFTCFVVDSDTPGIVYDRSAEKWQRTSDIPTIKFENVEVSECNVVGEPGNGFIIAMNSFNATKTTIAAMANGLTARCLDEASRYSLEHKSYNNDIYDFKGISFILVDMAINLELSRLMTIRSAYERCLGRPDTYYSSIAKAFAAETANTAAMDVVQIFRRSGYSSGYPVEKLKRDAKIFRICDNSSQLKHAALSQHILQRIKAGELASKTL